jgi:hypothetical protein
MFDVPFFLCTYLCLLGRLHLPVFQQPAYASVYIFRTKIKLDRLLLVVYVQTGMFDLGVKCSHFQ